MNPLYNDLRAIADGLIAEFGKTVEIRNPGTATGPAHAPTLGAPVVGSGSFVQVTDMQMLSSVMRPLVQVSDLAGLLSASATQPLTTASKVVVDGALFNVVAVEPLNPGGLLLLYETVLRK